VDIIANTVFLSLTSNNTVPPPPYKYQNSQHHHNPPNQNQGTSNSNINMTTLPYVNADISLRSLAAQAEGFGRCAIGGLDGSFVIAFFMYFLKFLISLSILIVNLA
jgi:hypothetical protein